MADIDDKQIKLKDSISLLKRNDPDMIDLLDEIIKYVKDLDKRVEALETKEK